jgi:hypothetical protein
MILAIDPGTTESGIVWIDKNYKPLKFGKISNKEVLDWVSDLEEDTDELVIEMIASYGMSVSSSVFETCCWIGAFEQRAEYVCGVKAHRMLRKDVKMNLCGQTKAKDTNIVQSLLDRFCTFQEFENNKGKGTKKNPGPFYGFKADIWQAYALGVTYIDKKKENMLW